MPAVRMIVDWPSTVEPSAQPGEEVDRRRRHRHDLAAHGEDPVHAAHALLEVAALERRHRGQQQVADGMAAQAAGPRHRRTVLAAAPTGKRYWSSSLMSGSASARAAMQLRMSPTGGMPSSSRRTPGRATVVGDGDHRGQVAGVLLEAAQQRRQPGPAADGHDPRAAGQEALLVDDLDERRAPRRRPSGAGGSRRGRRPSQPATTSTAPTDADDEPAQGDGRNWSVPGR